MPFGATMTTTTSTQHEFVHRAAWKAAVMGTLNVLLFVIAARLIVLVAVAGGIGLTWIALADPNAYRLGALGIYGALVALPSVWLASAIEVPVFGV